ncbi:MAG: anaerobic ribonucleoside-triphosphate reductase activating protein [Bacilli bacterium]|nr:anaerobic ribonucleoside-triphosphate reductase activating protein [Bacilli bacterium]
MDFVSINKLTLLDYPEKIACVLYTPTCNFACPYCHNWETLIKEKLPPLDFNEVLSFLKKRSGVLDGVVISGGEPTLMDNLPERIKEIKNLGYLVKLDTNGSNPEMLKKLIDENLIDYVAMDIKHSFAKYYDIIKNKSIDLDDIRKSIDILKENKVDYEFRITLIEEYHDKESIYEIGKLLEGSKRLFLQQYKLSDGVSDKSLHEIKEETANKYVDILSQYIDLVELRGY